MPIWAEVLIFALAAYALGLGLGWLLWGRTGPIEQQEVQ